MALMDRRLKDPFAVRFKDAAAKQNFTEWLCDQIRGACDARATITGPNGDLDYWHWLYEQGRTPEKQLPFPGAADLNSTIVTEKVDAIQARTVQTIFTEPVWTVEGWGKDAEKAPFAEEFHQWKLEDERLQQYVGKWAHQGFIEGTGILEVLDRADVRLITEKKRYAAQLGEDGTVLLDEQAQPVIQRDPSGRPVEASDEDAPFIETQTATYQRVRKGPGYRIVPLRDFVFLPPHAADKGDVYGYAKRCWVTQFELRERVVMKVYDKEAVDALGSQSDRDSIQPSLERAGQTIAEQRDGTEEKELWEVQVLYDCDGDGIREWYLCTVSTIDRVLLRIRKDDLGGLPKYLDFTPYPRADSVYGYSLVGDKLCTTAEEDTALRNMIANRSMMTTNPPIKVATSALWNPRSTPWGTGQILRVRQMNEIEPMVIPDVPASAFNQLAINRQRGDALTGLNDTALGLNSEDKRTATENSIVARATEIRVNEVVKNLQESLETLWLVRNEIWIRTLEGAPDGAMDAPEGIVRSIQTRGLTLENGRFTASMLRGNLRGKPRGSVETADKLRQRNDFGQSLQGLAMLAKMFPALQVIFQAPEAAEAVMTQWARLFNVPDRQAFTDPVRKMVQAMQAQAEQQQMMGGGMMPPGGGMPMGGGGMMPPGGGIDPMAMMQQMLGGGGAPTEEMPQ